MNALSRSAEVAWQRNYFEHVIRSNTELSQLRDYIATIPVRWEEDEYR
jgi:REP element-mobilizing transposase RayT